MSQTTTCDACGRLIDSSDGVAVRVTDLKSSSSPWFTFSLDLHRSCFEEKCQVLLAMRPT